ncbi:hypothetical protein OIU84_000618 [Salix udensis]|uniref:Uncharacterized protein n=1 Tax=Salix udensis TaxID=889485 RepID=A0AAD6L561_9ROSI|nr:hypothetical protein OIU84_000618 [Salix udensis]
MEAAIGRPTPYFLLTNCVPTFSPSPSRWSTIPAHSFGNPPSPSFFFCICSPFLVSLSFPYSSLATIAKPFPNRPPADPPPATPLLTAQPSPFPQSKLTISNTFPSSSS